MDHPYSRHSYPSRDSRTLKRTHAEAISNPSEVLTGQGDHGMPRTRASNACEKCRARKTKCDNLRPSCGYCLKHEIPCIYLDSISSPWSSSVSQILEAIENLTRLVERQQQPQPQPPQHQHQYQDYGKDAAPTSQRSLPARLPSQGVESILEWESLKRYKSASNLFADDTSGITTSTHLVPSTELRDLSRLESKYIIGVHLKNPILDLTELHQKVMHVAENGLDWSTTSCLVALVCAIGAVTQEYQAQSQCLEYTSSPGTPLPLFHSGSEPELSMQFWSLAAKRLGFAIGQNNIEAVQCLCLAGVWYMHHLQPLQAWKYFNLAGSAWYLVQMTHSNTHDVIDDGSRERSLTLMQSLYFTIWKSECELRLELDLAGSILEDLDTHDTFPSPPNLNNRSWDHESGHTERAWYYYLAEIAIRHLFNHLLRTYFWMTEENSERDIRAMVAQAEVIEAQIRDWHSALPPMFRFDIPSGTTLQTHPDDLTQILRNRYLACQDLMCRPFVRLCVGRQHNIDPQLGSRVITLANQGLQYCAFKLSQVKPHLHQGTWFGLRNVVTSSLVLIAAHNAVNTPNRPLAQGLILPEGWRQISSRAFTILSPYWKLGGSGGSEMDRVLQSALNDMVQV